jgi:HlyD family secretion protein
MRFFKNKRLIAGIVIVLAIVAMAMWPESIEVGVAAVERGPMQVTLDEDGETRVRDKFVVSAPVGGRLQRIELEPGDPVVRGKTIVARLTTADAPLLDPRTRGELEAAVEASRAAVGQARAELERATAELMRARTTLLRQQELMKAGAIAADNLDAAETAVATGEEARKAAEFAVSRAEYELQLARARLQAPTAAGRAVEVVAPVSGVILKRFRESESVVPVGEPLIEIGEPSRTEIVADFLSTDAVRIQPGSPVLVEGWGGSDPLKARVRRVEPAGFMKVSALGVEEQRVNVLIDFEDPSAAGRLGDGYRVEVRVVIWREEDVVKVPVGALFRRGNDWAAFLVDAEQARLQPVELGQRNDVEGQVLKGLSPQQTVVLHPPDTLMDGARISVRATP